MTHFHRTFIISAALALAAAAIVTNESQAGWGQYRAVTSYSVPSVPVYSPVVVQSAYRPVVVAPPIAAPAPVIVARPVVSAPPVIASPLVTAPAPILSGPQTSYYIPAAPVAVYPQAIVRQTVVTRPALFGTRVRSTYYAPSVLAPVPVIVP
jgi:hypothetical protein